MTRRLHHTGFSLVELMVAMAIGMIILTAMMSLIVTNIGVRTEMDKTNRMIENGRYAIDLLSDNIHLAGFMGQMDSSTISGSSTIPDPCDISSGTLIKDALPYYVQGYRAATSTTDLTLPAACTATNGPFPSGTAGILKPGSDVIVVRRVETRTVVQETLVGTSTWYLQPSLCRFDPLPPNDLVVSQTKADFIRRKTRAAAPDHCEETMTGTPTYAPLWPIVIQLYFVAQNNVAGDGLPTLKRAELTATGTWAITPLVEGVEYMKFEYGLDSSITPPTDNDGTADEYKDCSACTAAEWKQVVDVRAFVLARNIEQTASHTDTRTYKLSSDSLDPAANTALFQVPAANDHLKRQVYKQTIRLMNPGGRRAG